MDTQATSFLHLFIILQPLTVAGHRGPNGPNVTPIVNVTSDVPATIRVLLMAAVIAPVKIRKVRVAPEDTAVLLVRI